MGGKSRLRAPDPPTQSSPPPPSSCFSSPAADGGCRILCISHLSACCRSLWSQVPGGGSSSSFPSAPAPRNQAVRSLAVLMMCAVASSLSWDFCSFSHFTAFPLGLPPGVSTLSPQEGARPGSWPPDSTRGISFEPLWLCFPPRHSLILPSSTARCWRSFLRA